MDGKEGWDVIRGQERRGALIKGRSYDQNFHGKQREFLGKAETYEENKIKQINK